MAWTNLEVLEQSISHRRRSPTAEQLWRQRVLAEATGKTLVGARRRRSIKARRHRRGWEEVARERAELLVLEVQWLAGTDTDDSVARRLGYSAAANLDAAMRRIAIRYPDLAA